MAVGWPAIAGDTKVTAIERREFLGDKEQALKIERLILAVDHEINRLEGLT